MSVSVRLPDDSVRELPDGATGADLALSISPRLLDAALALRVDRHSVRGIAGTVAGEDALFIAIHGDATMDDVQLQVEQVLGPPQPHL